MLKVFKKWRLGAVLVAASSVLLPAALHATPWDDVEVVRVTTHSDLNFGKFAVMGSGGRVKMFPDGRRVLLGNIHNLGGDYGPAEATLSGRPHQSYLVVAPSAAWLRHRLGYRLPLAHIRVFPWKTGQLDRNGKAEIAFGADLNIPPTAEPGHYRGAVSFWVVYI